jgi:hypothetical protein
MKYAVKTSSFGKVRKCVLFRPQRYCLLKECENEIGMKNKEISEMF